MPELLLELLSEEIPARMQARAAADLKRLVTDGLKKAGLEFERADAYVTPRRLALVVEGIPAKQPDVKNERKGPRVGSPDKAIEGFLKSVGLTSLDQCEKREVKGNEFWFAITETKGGVAADVLPDVVNGAIPGLPWPKSMRWGSSAFAYVRPLESIVALFDGKPLKGAFALGPNGAEEIAFGNASQGHRFLGNGAIRVKDFADYKTKLADAKVMLDAAERRARIEKDAKALAKKAGLVLRDDPALLDEVAGLVEWPVVLMGAIDPEFMDVPPEVLITSMRSHQKYFALLDGKGALAPHFIVVANMETGDKGKAIVAGNERVLRARLSDAKFFWDQDRNHSLASRVPSLNAIIYHEALGTLGDKVDRVGALAAELSGLIGADKDKTRSAARLAKADLVTEMVGEFPELQGVMGRYYALNDKESPEVADAIAAHYAPQGPGDICPNAPVSVAVALADKLDTLTGFWAIGLKPTGSRDPYALRRAALGVIRLIIENKLRLPLAPFLNESAEMLLNQQITASVIEKRVAMDELGLEEQVALEQVEIEVDVTDHYGEVHALVPDLIAFFADRLKVHLREAGVRHDHIDAVFALGGQDDIVLLLARVDALAKFLGSEAGADLLVAYRRAANIVRIEEKKDDKRYGPVVDDRLLKQDEEATLWAALQAADRASHEALDEEDFGAAMAALARLREPVDRFFDEVTVNTDDPALRQNRLSLLVNIQMTMNVVADFSKVEGG